MHTSLLNLLYFFFYYFFYFFHLGFCEVVFVIFNFFNFSVIEPLVNASLAPVLVRSNSIVADCVTNF
ncbi:MAG: hypothetical protein FJZ59_07595 [Chlamydiae bacterium]|nr:hypothetical protein [Chlamydiota bacterium]